MTKLTHEPTTLRRSVLLLPGIGDSGPQHWQTRWDAKRPDCVRIQQHDWDKPICSEWMEALENAAHELGPDIFIAAHSLGCLLTAHWLTGTSCKIRGALLVAVPDPSGQLFPSAATGFAPLSLRRLNCHSIVVASNNDPYASLEFAQQCAEQWGSRFVNIGNAGHINADSGLGDWQAGLNLLDQLMLSGEPGQ